ncbi:ABC transporter substrate-binding protein [Pseudoflavonifractor sp. 524-17]|uniref:ABC transporter substrate-binding protein n=1 Tax=Pseudoflavonifractor sp. 524-17 TaxID=2304577 RepID=UPI00137B4629|nr:ABC transporter substrate-binding protein [Pseudoflavonifractor sp. 524-17]NCE63261.1 ABC transporter substrate-binding protein [Pseudoflavonifractor sp. 524-17]
MKKITSMALALLTAGALLSGCGTPASNTPPADTTSPAPSSTPAPSTAPEASTPPTGGERVDGGTLIMCEPSDISSLNIIYETGDEGMTMLKPVYDPLYIVAKDEVRYYLAESRTVSDDGLAITVKLRENLKWHDGEPITTDDILWNFEMRMNPDNKSSGGTKVNGEPVTVTAQDDYTFTVQLPSVSAAYDATLGGLKFLPKHVYESTPVLSGADINSTSGVGSGPFKVKQWNKGESLVLERFDDYYRGPASLESVVFKIIPNASAEEIAFQNGELSVMRLTTQDKLEKYSNDPNYQVYTLTEGRINYMGFNSNSPLTSDPKVRQAICLALNVDEIIAGAYGSSDLAPAAKTVFCPSNFYYTDVPGYSQDLEQAKQLIAEAGVEGETFRLVYNSSRENMENCALMIQQQLKAVGLNVEIQGYETQGFFEVFFYTDAGDWELGLNGYSTNGDNQGDEYMFSSEGFLSKNICTTDEIAQLWNQGDATNDPAQRTEIYKQIQEQIRDVYTMFPLTSPNFVIAVDKRLQGVDAIDMVPIFEDYLNLYMTN